MSKYGNSLMGIDNFLGLDQFVVVQWTWSSLDIKFAYVRF